ncbi:MAG: HAMP domain-containing protein [Patescibacteria group bacterium]|jgi:nitrogen fixation/metabolism regulation signal transduction histidine kinase
MFKNLKVNTKLLILLGISLIPFGLFISFSYYSFNVLNSEFIAIKTSIQDIYKFSSLDSAAQFIRYYDEVLTQSARNYAFTGDEKWQKRYQEAAPKLDEKIKAAITNGDDTDRTIFQSIDQANLALVKMEEDSMAKVAAGQKEEAVIILESDDYWQQKEIYQAGLEEYAKNRGKNYDDTLSISNTAFDQYTNDIEKTMALYYLVIILLLVIFIGFLILAYYLIRFFIVKPIVRINQATRAIAQGKLGERLDLELKDEIGDLANSFNQMSDNLKESKTNIEQKVASRTAELEKLNQLMVGRELKMIEFKKEIQRLKEKNENSR